MENTLDIGANVRSEVRMYVLIPFPNLMGITSSSTHCPQAHLGVQRLAQSWGEGQSFRSLVKVRIRGLTRLIAPST